MSLLLTTVSLVIVNAYRMNGFWCSMLSICKKSGETSLARFLWCLILFLMVRSPCPDDALTLSLSSIANHTLAPLMEAGDTSGVSYATQISILPRGEGTLATPSYIFIKTG